MPLYCMAAALGISKYFDKSMEDADPINSYRVALKDKVTSHGTLE